MFYPKNVQIPYELFLKIVDYIEDNADFNDSRYHEISHAFDLKLESLLRHVLYSGYKTAPTAALRAEARRRYLEMVCMRQSFRWTDEQDVSVNRSITD